jgi:hypothetical protein
VRQVAGSSSWAIVLGGDRTLAEAQAEARAFGQLGLPNTTIYLRQGSYRTVAAFGGREEAVRALEIARQRRKDAYVVDLSRWCSARTPLAGYLGCG